MRKNLKSKICDALSKLAFGNYADCVTLMSRMNSDDLNFSELDLFFIREIKLSRSGGCEIKFYDRIEALTALIDLAERDRQETAGESNFFKALSAAAAQTNGNAPEFET